MTDALDAPAPEPTVDPGSVLDLLADEDVRALFETAAGPRTIPELADACGLPGSTAYRTVKRLASAELLVPTGLVAGSTGPATEYRRPVDGIETGVGGETTVEFV